MNHSSDNPPENSLGEGLTDQNVQDAVRRSGYPLQNVVASELTERFDVTEEWGYVDRASGDHRSLDLHAYRGLAPAKSTYFDPALTLLVECKRSELPYVFFEAAIPSTPPDFPRVIGFLSRTFQLHSRSANASRDTEPAVFMGLHEFHFIRKGPPICNAFTRAERKGKALNLSGDVPFNAVILPLISALDHWASMIAPIKGQEKYYPNMSLCVCVLDAPMIIAGGSEADPTLTLRPWVRVVRGEASKVHKWTTYRHYVVDFVHKAFVKRFIGDHIAPFADEFADRLLTNEALFKRGRATVADWDNWEFADLMAVG